MAYVQRIKQLQLSPQAEQAILVEFDLLRAELDDIRTKFGTLLTKLDADVGVTDVNYASTQALPAAKFKKI